MKNHRLNLIMLSLALLGPLALTACTVSAEDVIETIADPVNTAPPPDQIEFMPSYNKQMEIWMPGYWSLMAGRFVWVKGHLVTRPSTTAVWTAPRWVHHTYGWTFECGHWQ